MVSSLPNEDWIVGGDFNIVEWEGDWGGGVGSMVCGIEKQKWQRCKSTLRLILIITRGRKGCNMEVGSLSPLFLIGRRWCRKD